MRSSHSLLLSAGLLMVLTGCKSAPKTETATGPTPLTMDTAKGPRIYVTDEVSGELTVIDATTMTRLEQLKIGTRPRGIHPRPIAQNFLPRIGDRRWSGGLVG